MRSTILAFLLLASTAVFAQTAYRDSLRYHIRDYVEKHEVVKGADRAGFQFYEINQSYRVIASFERKENMPWFQMETSGPVKKLYRVYGVAKFTLNGTAVKLNIYQSQDLLNNAQYQNYLFVPFTDATSGTDTYSGGRYIDLKIEDIKNNTVALDFNKAYNPYCAYVSGKYNCPVPPQDNHLSVAVKAGERAFHKD